MSVIYYELTSNQEDSHQMSPSWCVAFVRFAQPTSAYSGKANLLSTKPLMIVENDCISVSIQNSKSSFAKTCSITMKAGDIYYLNAVAPGDWVVAWMHENQTKTKDIIKSLRGEGNASVNDWNSGLKFIGRVLSVDHNEQMNGGSRSVTQTINCQAFLELASSIYFTEVGDQLVAGAQGSQLGQELKTSIMLGRDRFKNFSSKFYDFMINSLEDPNKALTPDRVVQFLIILLFGIDKTEMGFKNPVTNENLRGNYNDAIFVPSAIANVVGLKNVNRLWQFYNVQLGIQKFAANNIPWKAFNPIQTAGSSARFKTSPTPCKGWVQWTPPQWSNVPIWSILQQYSHQLLNELYTVLRCDETGVIRPTIVMRERPFSTGLFDAIRVGDKVVPIQASNTKKTANKLKAPKQLKTAKSKSAAASQKQLEENASFNLPTDTKANQSSVSGIPFNANDRSFYYNLPRWKIDDSLILGYNVATSESSRVNFVQVWGQAVNNGIGGQPNGDLNSSDVYRRTQILEGNFCIDDQDITRNGLRADIQTTPYDMPGQSIFTAVPHWARMRADWMFNGHLHLQGTVTLAGVQYPICEGDNVEIRGIVYHIESVTHTGILSGSATRTFRTTLSLSRGMLASSLKNKKQIPSYSINRSITPEQNNMPGLTDYEVIPKRSDSGDRLTDLEQDENKGGTS